MKPLGYQVFPVPLGKAAPPCLTFTKEETETSRSIEIKINNLCKVDKEN